MQLTISSSIWCSRSFEEAIDEAFGQLNPRYRFIMSTMTERRDLPVYIATGWVGDSKGVVMTSQPDLKQLFRVAHWMADSGDAESIEPLISDRVLAQLDKATRRSSRQGSESSALLRRGSSFLSLHVHQS